jgi:hypothetical protein
MSPHGFRHYFITQRLAQRWSVDEVSTMVGTRPQGNSQDVCRKLGADLIIRTGTGFEVLTVPKVKNSFRIPTN